MKKRLKFIIPLLLVLGAILVIYWEPITGYGSGTMTVVYQSQPEAERIRNEPGRCITFPKASVTLIPQKSLAKTTSVRYLVKTYNVRSFGFKTEKEFIDLIRPLLHGNPQEIYHVSIPSLAHSDNSHQEAIDIKRVWERFAEDRPSSCYSPNEVRAILPQAYHATFDQQFKENPKHIWLDWPKDRRKLYLHFSWSGREQSYLLTEVALAYPNKDAGPKDTPEVRYKAD